MSNIKGNNMKKYKMRNNIIIDNITGKEQDILTHPYDWCNFNSDEILDFVKNGYACERLTDKLIRISKIYRIGQSNFTKYIIFQEI